MAAPTATPTMPDSATGVSIDLASPKRCCSSLVAPNAPPCRPTSSPMQNTRSSTSISSCSAWRIASRYVSSGTDVVSRENAPVGFLGRRVLVVARTLHRLAHLVADPLADRLQPRLVHAALLAQVL